MNSFSNIKKKRFQRSIRIDTDFEDNNVLSSYVNSATSNRALKELCNHISTSGQCAFTWTGPYGSGKSSLAVMLNADFYLMENLIVIKLLALLSMMIQLKPLTIF